MQSLTDDRPGAFHAVGPAEPVTPGGLIETCPRVAGTQVEIVPVPPETVPPLFPLIRPYWPSQQRSPAPAGQAACWGGPWLCRVCPSGAVAVVVPSGWQVMVQPH